MKVDAEWQDIFCDANPGNQGGGSEGGGSGGCMLY